MNPDACATRLADPVLWRRVMVVAPHPDDESLAAAGLLARAVARGAAVRIVYLTDGEENPWPQRLLLRRWRITAGERRQWAARRRAEVRSAVRCLAVPEHTLRFLGLPDQGLTRLALQGDDPLGPLVTSFQPTLLVVPAAHDRHPDHGATAVLAARALVGLEREARPLALGYVVHGRRNHTQELRFALTAAEQQVKLEAVLCHRSQLMLSRRRFLAHVRDSEYFTEEPFESSVGHPLAAAVVEDGVVRLRLAPPHPPSGRRAVVLVASDTPGAHGARCVVVVGRDGEATVPLGAVPPVGRVFVKLEQRWPFLIFDRAGWRPALVRGPAAASAGIAARGPLAAEGRPGTPSQSSIVW